MWCLVSVTILIGSRPTARVTSIWSHCVYMNWKQKLVQATECIRNYQYHWLTCFCSVSCSATRFPQVRGHPPLLHATFQCCLTCISASSWVINKTDWICRSQLIRKQSFCCWIFCAWCLTWTISAQPRKWPHQHNQSSAGTATSIMGGKWELLRICLMSNPVYLMSHYILKVTKEGGKEIIISLQEKIYIAHTYPGNMTWTYINFQILLCTEIKELLLKWFLGANWS